MSTIDANNYTRFLESLNQGNTTNITVNKTDDGKGITSVTYAAGGETYTLTDTKLNDDVIDFLNILIETNGTLDIGNMNNVSEELISDIRKGGLTCLNQLSDLANAIGEAMGLDIHVTLTDNSLKKSTFSDFDIRELMKLLIKAFSDLMNAQRQVNLNTITGIMQALEQKVSAMEKSRDENYNSAIASAIGSIVMGTLQIAGGIASVGASAKAASSNFSTKSSAKVGNGTGDPKIKAGNNSITHDTTPNATPTTTQTKVDVPGAHQTPNTPQPTTQTKVDVPGAHQTPNTPQPTTQTTTATTTTTTTTPQANTAPTAGQSPAAPDAPDAPANPTSQTPQADTATPTTPKADVDVSDTAKDGLTMSKLDTLCNEETFRQAIATTFSGLGTLSNSFAAIAAAEYTANAKDAEIDAAIADAVLEVLQKMKEEGSSEFSQLLNTINSLLSMLKELIQQAASTEKGIVA